MNNKTKLFIIAIFILSNISLFCKVNYNKPLFINSLELNNEDSSCIAQFADGKFIVNFKKNKVDFEIISEIPSNISYKHSKSNLLTIDFTEFPAYEIEYNDAKINFYTNQHIKTNINSIKSIKYNFHNKLAMKFIYDNELKLEIVLLQNFKELENTKLFEIISNEIIESLKNSIQIENANGRFSLSFPEFLEIKQNNGISEVLGSNNLTDKVISLENLLELRDTRIEYCSYIGGSFNDWIMSIAVDDEENMYVAGMTTSYDLPAISSKINLNFQNEIDIYILKMDKNKKMIWSTYWGGNQRDYIYNIKLDSKGNIWVAGDCESYNIYLTENAFQKTLKGNVNGLVGKLNKDGELIYASLLGGNGYSSFTIFDIDKNDNIWLSGRTTSSNFPLTSDAYKKTNNLDYDTFLSKMSNDGKLIYSSYFGSERADIMEGFYVTDDFKIIQSGFTNSSSFPNINTEKMPFAGAYDTFIVKYDSTGKPEWSRTFGGTGFDLSRNLITDSKGNIYVSGYSNSNDLPKTKGAFQSSNNGLLDVFISKFNSDGGLIKTTFFGGSDNEGTNNELVAQWGGIFIDKNDKIYLSGYSQSRDLWTSNNALFTENQGLCDQFILKFDEELNPEYSTYFGGKSNDYGKDIIMKNNVIYSVGWTQSDDLPISNDSYQKKYKSQIDGYILQLNLGCKNSFDLAYVKDFGILSFVGNAFAKSKSLILTMDMNNQIGGVWHKLQFSVTKSFEINFSFRMLNPKKSVTDIDKPYPGADGIAFVIQNSSHIAKGGLGGDLGYSGIPNSIAVEYDMFYNANHTKYKDPNGNHVAIMSNGKNPNTAEHNSYSTLAINYDIIPMNPNGTVYYSKIEYDVETKLFSVYLDSTNELSIPILSKNIDFASMLDLTNDEFAWFGLTSATADDYMIHEILSWDVCAEATYNILSDVEYDESSKLEYSIYPNPTHSYIKIDKLSITNTSKFILCDIHGKEIETRNIVKIESDAIIVNLLDLKAGLYYLTIYDNQEAKNFKLIKY